MFIRCTQWFSDTFRTVLGQSLLPRAAVLDSDSPQQRGHLRGRVLLHRWQGVSVDVVRDVGLCVAEMLRHDLHGNARLECQGRARVTEMRAFLSAKSFLQNRYSNFEAIRMQF